MRHLLLLLAVGCGGGDPAPRVTVTRTPLPSAPSRVCPSEKVEWLMPAGGAGACINDVDNHSRRNQTVCFFEWDTCKARLALETPHSWVELECVPVPHLYGYQTLDGQWHDLTSDAKRCVTGWSMRHLTRGPAHEGCRATPGGDVYMDARRITSFDGTVPGTLERPPEYEKDCVRWPARFAAH